MRRSRLLIFLVAVMTLALFAVPVRRSSAQEAPPEATPTPRFTDTVEVEGRRIGLTCAGSGRPTVVLIGGSRGPGDRVWPSTVDAVSPMTRVCVFDRAGLGVSDPAPTSPQTAADVVADLHAALGAAGETGPYVPVGFSFGGLVARLYASTYPDEVDGLVLVEGVPPGLFLVDLTLGSFSSETEREAYRAFVAGRDPDAPGPVDQIVSEAQVVGAPPSPRVPTMVIVAGMIELGVPPEGNVLWSNLEAVAALYELQAGQIRNLGARIVIAEQSGHLVPFDQPELVIAAIEDVVAAVRDPGTWDTPVAATPTP